MRTLGEIIVIYPFSFQRGDFVGDIVARIHFFHRLFARGVSPDFLFSVVVLSYQIISPNNALQIIRSAPPDSWLLLWLARLDSGAVVQVIRRSWLSFLVIRFLHHIGGGLTVFHTRHAFGRVPNTSGRFLRVCAAPISPPLIHRTGLVHDEGLPPFVLFQA